MARRSSRDVRHGPVISHVAGDGPPLLLVHGLGGSWRWWRRNVAALSAGYRVIGVDLPGFGASHPDSRFVLEHLPDQLVELMDTAGIERAHVIGHSMGGVVVSGLAAEHPTRVDRLVLVDAGFVALDPSWRRRVTGVLSTVPRSSLSLAPVLVQDVFRSGIRRMAGATSEVMRSDWDSKLASIAAPTLVVWGQHDGICSPRIGRHIAATIPGARLVMIEGAAHNPMWERASEFDREVLAFLGS